jgi:hypothetical protein
MNSNADAILSQLSGIKISDENLLNKEPDVANMQGGAWFWGSAASQRHPAADSKDQINNSNGNPIASIPFSKSNVDTAHRETFVPHVFEESATTIPQDFKAGYINVSEV